jgi:hypothetical protein
MLAVVSCDDEALSSACEPRSSWDLTKLVGHSLEPRAEQLSLYPR